MQESFDRLLPGLKILAIYRCGSVMYGQDTEESDADYTVIVEKLGQPAVVKDEGLDLFVFDVDYYKKLLGFEDGIISYFAVWVDNTLLAEENLVFIDPSFKGEFERLVDVDWGKAFYRWLSHVVEYYALRVQFPDHKNVYNLYRIESEVRHYLESGRFEAVFPPEAFEKSQDLKLNKNIEKHLPELRRIFSYLEQVLKEGKT